MTNNSPEESPEEILKNELNRAEALGNAIAEQGREITQFGQRLTDQAKATQQAAQYLPDQFDREQLIEDWQHVNRAYRSAHGNIFQSTEQLSLYSGTASTAYVNSLHTFTTNNLLPLNSPEVHTYIVEAVDSLNNIFARAEIKNETLSMIALFRLDTCVPVKKNPSELLEIAYRAYEQPLMANDPVSTSLVPMRECIRTIIAELLRRRPNQGKASSEYDKIISIGNQLKREDINNSQVHTWASQWGEINDELSDSKQASLNREEWAKRLHRAIAFLNGLLRGLDPTKVNRE